MWSVHSIKDKMFSHERGLQDWPSLSYLCRITQQVRKRIPVRIRMTQLRGVRFLKYPETFLMGEVPL